MTATRAMGIVACVVITLSAARHLATPIVRPVAAQTGSTVARQSPLVVPVSSQTTASETAPDVPGKTQPVPGRIGLIAPTVLHPVTRVLVAPGDRVKAGQPLVQLDSDEPEADVRAKKAILAELEAGLARLKAMPREAERAEARANLEAARVAITAARQCHERFEGLRQKDSMSLHQLQEAHAALLKAEAGERAAQAHLECLLKHPVSQEIAEMEARVAAAEAELEAAEAELEHYTVNASIDGIITRLEVSPGMVSRPGTSLWGEILDLREIDVRCNVTPDQVESLVLGKPAEVVQPGTSTLRWQGRVVFVGHVADPQTGRVPVVVRIGDARERLRSQLDVAVRFGPALLGELGTDQAPSVRSAPSPAVTAR